MSFAKSGSGGRSSLGSASRRNSILVAVLSAVLAAALIYLFVSHYRKASPPAAPLQTTVWEAARNIPRGTTEATAAGAGLFKSVTVPAKQAVAGAIADPSVIVGDAAAVPITAGQQITLSDFTHTTDTLSSALTGVQRAVAFSLDAEHGLTSFLQPGNTVDIMGVAGGTSTLLLQNIPILSNAGGLVVLRLTDRQSLLLTAATGAYTLWLSLRPSLKASDSIQVGSVGK
jgi:Flp pilus assembly protein CpaB